VAKIVCKLPACKYYKKCKQKSNPFKNNALCKGYEEYINQDTLKNNKEILFADINIRLDHLIVKNDQYIRLNKKGEIIKFFFFYRLPIKIIANQLYCSEQYVYKIIKEAKEILFKRFVLK
jgi:hypothetical protein